MAGMPLEAFLGEAVVCAFSGKGPGEVVEPGDFEAAGVRAGDIVLVRTNSEIAGDLP